MSSAIRICGESKAECGYCNSSVNTKVTYGVLSDSMMVDDYERLMLIGWRRSGDYFYKPIMHITCCPQYTIRLNVANFVESKKQRQVIRKFKQSYATTTSAFTIETALPKCTPEIFELYKKYQVIVHKDSPEEITEASFSRFLVISPLRDNSTGKRSLGPEELLLSPESAPVLPSDSLSSSSSAALSTTQVFPYKYGTYHQLYRINGKLIAVGVIDILPSGLSSVYLFYDPDERHLVLGKVTALKEIEFCKFYNLEYYYMGYYIHSCEKMRYKSEYAPSELMCPTTMKFFPLKECVKYLDVNEFSPFDPELAEERRVEVASTTKSSSSLSSSTLQKLSSSTLTRYAPRFPGLNEFDFNAIKISLGDDATTLSIRELHSNGRMIVKKLFVELFGLCGGDILSRFTFKFN